MKRKETKRKERKEETQGRKEEKRKEQLTYSFLYFFSSLPFSSLPFLLYLTKSLPSLSCRKNKERQYSEIKQLSKRRREEGESLKDIRQATGSKGREIEGIDYSFLFLPNLLPCRLHNSTFAKFSNDFIVISVRSINQLI